MTSLQPKTKRKARKVTEIINDYTNKPFYTFEVFPPKTSPGTTNLISRISRMKSLNPAWLHVTWGAGGSTSERSLQLAEVTQNELEVDVCLHLTCTNMEQSLLDRTLERAKEMGIVNLLALRGDPPRGEEYWVAASDEFQHATDLVKYIRERYGDYFCIGVAGYPEGHADSEDKALDVDYLFEKQEAGAEFIITQLFYDVSVFQDWLKACRKRGITIPILPGIMPIQNYQSFRRMTNLCKSCLPSSLVSDLEKIQHDDSAVKAYGVELAIKMMKDLKSGVEGEGLTGFHLCTLNLEKSVTRVLEGLGWVGEGLGTGERGREGDGKMGSNGDSMNLLVPLPKVVDTLRGGEVSGGGGGGGAGGELVRKDSPTSWDEFPNGRFGDARSPAFGDLDGYGAGLKVPPAEALRLWGHPTSLSDISQLFTSYLLSTLSSIPWSEEPLRAETTSISTYLQRLNNEKNWWTVGSQPSVDGVDSSDPIHGFGPDGGYIYQKAFVEFFLEEEELEVLERRLLGEGEGGIGGKIKYFAGNRKGEKRSNMDKGDVNAVTWGVFPGKEIVTTTLIEEMSFEAWKEEAFQIFYEWAHLYPLQSPSRKFLMDLADRRWLVSVVHHNYKDEEGLWKWLLGDD